MQLSPIVCLDSSTWGHLAKNRLTDPDAKRILALFYSHALLPFFTYYHVEELTQHGDDAVFQNRVRLIRTLPSVAFLKLPHDIGNVGDVLPLREAEIAVLVQYPEATHEQIIETAGPQIRNGFCSGEDFCEMNAEWWEFYRKHFARDRLAKRMEIESVTQFPIPGAELDRKIPVASKSYRLRTKEEMRKYLEHKVPWLAEQIRNRGDKRIPNPEQIAFSFLKKVYEDTIHTYDTKGDFYENVLASDGIDRARLPSNATVADVGYEDQFITTSIIHEKTMGLPPGTLRQTIRQDMVPSWIVWREVDRAMKRFPTAQGSSWNDKMIVSFALYVDALEADKRVRDCVKQAESRHPLLKIVKRKLLQRKSYQDLALQLEQLASGAHVRCS